MSLLDIENNILNLDSDLIKHLCMSFCENNGYFTGYERENHEIGFNIINGTDINDLINNSRDYVLFGKRSTAVDLAGKYIYYLDLCISSIGEYFNTCHSTSVRFSISMNRILTS